MKDGWEKKDEFNQGYHDKVTNGKDLTYIDRYMPEKADIW